MLSWTRQGNQYGLHRDYTCYVFYAAAYRWAALTALWAERSVIRDICRTYSGEVQCHDQLKLL